MIPKKIYLNYVHEDDEEKTWCVDPVYVEDCEMQNREYTDLSQVWHDAKEEPKAGRQVIAIKDNTAFCGIYRPYDNKGYTPRYQGLYYSEGGCLSGSIWVYWKDVVKWAYIEDLLPKGGEK